MTKSALRQHYKHRTKYFKRVIKHSSVDDNDLRTQQTNGKYSNLPFNVIPKIQVARNCSGMSINTQVVYIDSVASEYKSFAVNVFLSE